MYIYIYIYVQSLLCLPLSTCYSIEVGFTDQDSPLGVFTEGGYYREQVQRITPHLWPILPFSLSLKSRHIAWGICWTVGPPPFFRMSRHWPFCGCTTLRPCRLGKKNAASKKPPRITGFTPPRCGVFTTFFVGKTHGDFLFEHLWLFFQFIPSVGSRVLFFSISKLDSQRIWKTRHLHTNSHRKFAEKSFTLEVEVEVVKNSLPQNTRVALQSLGWDSFRGQRTVRNPRNWRHFGPETWYTGKWTAGTWKSPVWKGKSSSKSPFLGSMLIFRCVLVWQETHLLQTATH